MSDWMANFYEQKAPEDGFAGALADADERDRREYLQDLVRIGNAIRRGTATEDEEAWFDAQTLINSERMHATPDPDSLHERVKGIWRA